MIIERYVAGRIALAGAAALALLLVLFSFLDHAEALEDVGKGMFTTADAVSVTLLTTPSRIVDLLPVCTLLASVLGLGMLANHQELTAIRAAGVSSWRIAATLATVSAGIACAALVLLFLVIPIAERQAQEFRSRTLEQTSIGGAEFWSRHDRRIIRVGKVAFGRLPTDIEIYELDADARLARLLRAKRAAILDADEWLLQDVTEMTIAGDVVEARTLPRLRWRSFLSPDQVSTLVAPAHALSPADILRFLNETGDSGLDTRVYETRFWQQASLPLTIVGMMLLGLPLVAGSVRSRTNGFRILVGATIGIGFYLFERITSQLATLVDVEPGLAACMPGAVVLAFALAGIRRLR